MLNDQARNDAFERAIAKAACGRRLVLDIGTGSGLLAVMAARAGAERVVACEANTPLARVATRVIARNGYADRVAVIAKRSTELAVGRDLPESADLLISEILDAGLLGEGVMRTFRHACAALNTADAAVIPAGATVWGQFVECPELRRVNPIKAISGFDLGEFDIFRNPAAHLQVALAHESHRVLSEAFEMACFDFRRLPGEGRTRPVEIPVTADGTAQAGRVLVRPAARRRHHTVDAPGRRQQALAPSPHLLRARPPGAARRDAAADRRPHRQPFLLPLA